MTSPAIFNPVEHNKTSNACGTDTGTGTGKESFSEDIDEETSFSASSVTDVPRPPDGGWGWAVVFASFMIHVIGKCSYRHSQNK
jgi:hypothetical protein